MNERLSIVFSNYDDLDNPFYGGGGARAIHEVAKRLARRHEVTVVTGTYPGATATTVDGVRYERVGTNRFGPKIGQVCFSLVLPFFARRKRADIWYESLTPPCSFSFTPLCARMPVVGVAHMLSGEDMRRKYRLPFDRLERVGLRLYRRFVVLSEAVAAKVRTANPRADVVIIPNGVEPRPASAPVRDGGHVLFLGRVEMNQKGLDLLAGAWDRLVDDAPCGLVIAGSGAPSENAELARRIANGVRPKTVTALGRVDEAAKDRLYRTARFVVVPSRFETFSMIVLEAFSYGRPVIVFDIPNMAWVPDRCAVKVPPFDTEALAAAMRSLLSDPARCASMGEEARTFSGQYDWDVIAKRYEDHAVRTIRPL